MKNKKNKNFILLFYCLFFIIQNLFCNESFEHLLQGYFENNLSLEELSNKVAYEILQKKASNIENGFDISLSTGKVTITTGTDGTVSFTPSLSVELPQANNLKLSASSNFDFSTSDSNNNSITNTKLKLSTDIYSGTAEQRNVLLEKADRELLTAQRNLQNGFLSAETEFYKDIKNLYETASKIITARKNLYEDQLDFEQIKAKGYAPSSTKYKLSQMKVIEDERTVENYERTLERETKIFSAKCGYNYTENNAFDFLPETVPVVDAVDIRSFNREDYAQLENAQWTHYINEKTRNAQKDISVSANAGYTFKNEIKNSYTDTVDAGASLTWNDSGLTASAGVSFPVNKNEPVYDFSLSFTPNNFRLSSISKEQKIINENQENIAIKNARIEYANSVISLKTELEEILWNKNSNLESYEMYDELEKDLAAYFEKGIITESEYKSAQVNKENYRILCIINNIDLIIYNNKTKQLFVRDKELKSN